MTVAASVEHVQDIISRTPYLSWLGLKVLALGPDSIEVRATWREEWGASPTVGQTPGGILAAVIDFTADFALMGALGRAAPTIDLRVDYHRMTIKSDLIAKGKIIKLGKQVSVCEARLYDDKERLVASGRGSFFTAPPSS